MASTSVIIITSNTNDFIDFASFAKLTGASATLISDFVQIDADDVETLFNPVVIIDADNVERTEAFTSIEKVQKQNMPFFVAATTVTTQVFEDFRSLKPAGFFLKPLALESCMLNINQALFNSGTTKLKTQKLEELFVKNGKDYVRISAEDILWVQASGNYIEIFTTYEKSYLLRVGLKDIEGRLPEDQFIRVHKSYIVNKKHILKFNSNSIRTSLGEVPLARSYFNSVLTAFTVI